MPHTDEEPGLLALCYLNWCKSPKTWCRFFCILCTLAHGAVYAVVACLLILDLRLSSYVLLVDHVEKEWLGGGPMADTYLSVGVIVFHFLLALPYLSVAAVGSRSVKLLFFVFLCCTAELLSWLGLLVLAVVVLSYVSSELKVVVQWSVLAGMISLLFMCWTLLMMTWKKRRHEELLAMHTARVISNRNKKRKKSTMKQQHQVQESLSQEAAFRA